MSIENPEASKKFIKLKKAYDGLLSDEPKKIIMNIFSTIIGADLGDLFNSIIKDFRERDLTLLILILLIILTRLTIRSLQTP